MDEQIKQNLDKLRPLAHNRSVRKKYPDFVRLITKYERLLKELDEISARAERAQRKHEKLAEDVQDFLNEHRDILTNYWRG